MPDEVQHDIAPPSSKGISGTNRGNVAHQARLVLLSLLAVCAVLVLLIPINFEKSYGIFDKETRKLECGSVIFPQEKAGATTYNADCAVARSRHLGYAGLCLAGAVAVTAFGLARLAGGRAGDTTARRG
ncbi:hypothetical protein Q3V23_13905 [Streptomyces sp. VNUA116]|uniref:hypothetical protein n=1 Tax=Streptomyces sp. VNUA116 TaxID=3062449 RepID=UPI0026747DB5|nr:hypothetical protein [Streptomyces sp. VNUA116]WKU45076.1 hypothetical protein Q3V23_13905 [Streptomyces sp. VNUA116]